VYREKEIEREKERGKRECAGESGGKKKKERESERETEREETFYPAHLLSLLHVGTSHCCAHTQTLADTSLHKYSSKRLECEVSVVLGIHIIYIYICIYAYTYIHKVSFTSIFATKFAIRFLICDKISYCK